ncbi:hypothetical protein BGW38_003595, partial [Lunasporangiospora selenospora]
TRPGLDGWFQRPARAPFNSARTTRSLPDPSTRHPRPGAHWADFQTPHEAKVVQSSITERPPGPRQQQHQQQHHLSIIPFAKQDLETIICRHDPANPTNTGSAPSVSPTLAPPPPAARSLLSRLRASTLTNSSSNSINTNNSIDSVSTTASRSTNPWALSVNYLEYVEHLNLDSFVQTALRILFSSSSSFAPTPAKSSATAPTLSRTEFLKPTAIPRGSRLIAERHFIERVLLRSTAPRLTTLSLSVAVFTRIQRDLMEHLALPPSKRSLRRTAYSCEALPKATSSSASTISSASTSTSTTTGAGPGAPLSQLRRLNLSGLRGDLRAKTIKAIQWFVRRHKTVYPGKLREMAFDGPGDMPVNRRRHRRRNASHGLMALGGSIHHTLGMDEELEDLEQEVEEGQEADGSGEDGQTLNEVEDEQDGVGTGHNHGQANGGVNQGADAPTAPAAPAAAADLSTFDPSTFHINLHHLIFQYLPEGASLADYMGILAQLRGQLEVVDLSKWSWSVITQDGLDLIPPEHLTTLRFHTRTTIQAAAPVVAPHVGNSFGFGLGHGNGSNSYNSNGSGSGSGSAGNSNGNWIRKRFPSLKELRVQAYNAGMLTPNLDSDLEDDSDNDGDIGNKDKGMTTRGRQSYLLPPQGLLHHARSLLEEEPQAERDQVSRQKMRLESLTVSGSILDVLPAARDAILTMSKTLEIIDLKAHLDGRYLSEDGVRQLLDWSMVFSPDSATWPMPSTSLTRSAGTPMPNLTTLRLSGHAALTFHAPHLLDSCPSLRVLSLLVVNHTSSSFLTNDQARVLVKFMDPGQALGDAVADFAEDTSDPTPSPISIHQLTILELDGPWVLWQTDLELIGRRLRSLTRLSLVGCRFGKVSVQSRCSAWGVSIPSLFPDSCRDKRMQPLAFGLEKPSVRISDSMGRAVIELVEELKTTLQELRIHRSGLDEVVVSSGRSSCDSNGLLDATSSPPPSPQSQRPRRDRARATSVCLAALTEPTDEKDLAMDKLYPQERVLRRAVSHEVLDWAIQSDEPSVQGAVEEAVEIQSKSTASAMTSTRETVLAFKQWFPTVKLVIQEQQHQHSYVVAPSIETLRRLRARIPSMPRGFLPRLPSLFQSGPSLPSIRTWTNTSTGSNSSSNSTRYGGYYGYRPQGTLQALTWAARRTGAALFGRSNKA